MGSIISKAAAESSFCAGDDITQSTLTVAIPVLLLLLLPMCSTTIITTQRVGKCLWIHTDRAIYIVSNKPDRVKKFLAFPKTSIEVPRKPYGPSKL